MKKFLLFAALFILSGCSMPGFSINHAVFHETETEILPKKIIIKSFGTTRFSGLIALVPIKSGLQFTLLDSMGVTLLKAECDKGGNVNVQGGVPQIANSNLPGLLAESLRRIYLLEPADSPCSTRLLTSFCREAAPSCQSVKYIRNGPFLSWKVCYTDDKKATIIYTRPLAGFSLSLADINPHTTQSHSGEL